MTTTNYPLKSGDGGANRRCIQGGLHTGYKYTSLGPLSNSNSNNAATAAATTTTTTMATPWDRNTDGDEDYRAWLLKDMAPGEYNLLNPVARRTLCTQFEQQQQRPQSSTVGRTIPEHYVPVLLSLAVTSMKSGWENISSECTKSESSITRNNSVSHYGLRSQRTCQILGTNTAHVKNVHMWPHNNSEAMVLVDLQPSDINDPRNILRLHKDIEYYLDRFHLTLVSSGRNFVLKVLDDSILPSRIKDRSKTFGDIDWRTLQCRSGKLPWRRLLATHSILAHQKA